MQQYPATSDLEARMKNVMALAMRDLRTEVGRQVRSSPPITCPEDAEAAMQDLMRHRPHGPEGELALAALSLRIVAEQAMALPHPIDGAQS